MGEVYKAHDARLSRDVAIKIVAAASRTDPDRLHRFEQEARAAAALNHPNILAVYDIGQHDGSPYIVSELLDGETLRERCASPLPVRKAVEYAIQVARGLAAAHDKGIVHRDLKPENLFVTTDERVKILDFGLAKLVPPETSSATALPTAAAHTREGVVLGTMGYMAPEQVRGLSADHRADIFAFGAILYEMLSGRRAFGGETAADTISAILDKDPPTLSVTAHIPLSLERIVNRCLDKTPAGRFQSTRDLTFALEALESPSGVEAALGPLPATQRLGVRVWQSAAVVLALVAGAALWGWWHGAQAIEPPHTVARIDIDLGPNASPESTTGPSAILSPDGTRLVFVSQPPGEARRLFTRRLDEPRAVELPGTDGAYGPFFKPDGEWVGFFANGKLKKTRVDGSEQPRDLCDAPAGRGASWSEDGVIIASLNVTVGLSRVNADGGPPALLTTLQGAERGHRWPQVLPGGKAVLFTVNTNIANYSADSFDVATLADGRRTTVLDHAGMFPRYLSSGHLVFVKKGTLYAVAYDVAQVKVVGTPRPVLEDVSNDQAFGFAQLDVSANGTLLYHRGGPLGLRTIQWLDRTGKTEPAVTEPALYLHPRVSPDGNWIAYAKSDGLNTNLWVYDRRTGSHTRAGRRAWRECVSRVVDGLNIIVFSQTPHGGLFWVPSNAAQKPQQLDKSRSRETPGSLARDGTLVFSEISADGTYSIKTLALQNTSGSPQAGEAKLFLEHVAGNPFPAISPDGRWLAYAGTDGGSYQVSVRAFPDANRRGTVSAHGGVMPVWSPNRKELFYRTVEDQRIMVVTYSIDAAGTFISETPHAWAETRLANVGLTLNFDLAPDGRFAVLMPADTPESRETRGHVTVVPTFFDEVRRRLAAGGK